MNPADKVEKWAINKLIPYARNARTHSDEQISQLAASIKEWGWTTPVLVDEQGSIIAGHGRTLAAQRLQMTEVPVMVAKGWSEAKKRAYVLADNKLAMNAGWDNEMLALELGEIGDLGFDLDLTGFTADEIAALMPEQIEPGLTDEDEVPEVPEQPVTVLGDVWVLGKHRVMCGDSTSIDAVDKLMAGQKADILFTDPPYGINFKPQRGTHDIILNDNLEGKEFDEFLDGTFATALASMKPDTYAFIWTGWSKIGAFERSIQKFFKIQAMHVWVKNNFGIGYYSRPKHEPFYLCLNRKPVYPSTAPADVWDAARVHKTVHSCEKPVVLITDILDTYHKNSLVLDLFGGSGSTLIACEKTGRHANLMELDPKFCDVIVKRWQDFTGKIATHAETGKPFAEVHNDSKT